tara:strand:+ start:537 stop:758 length:222 start_codon:yes stop_codon:yes gene_type:complete
MRAKDIPEISHLSVPEKILFIEDLWDSIVSKDSEVPIPESHKEELDKRFEKHSKSPGELLSLKELQARVESRR